MRSEETKNADNFSYNCCPARSPLCGVIPSSGDRTLRSLDYPVDPDADNRADHHPAQSRQLMDMAEDLEERALDLEQEQATAEARAALEKSRKRR